ncbi:MAG: Gfo/Idh/MocA family oxidoreductase [Bacilli bacterium]
MKVAIIGLGNVSKYYIQVFSSSPNYTLVAGVDLEETRQYLNLKGQGVKLYKDYQDLKKEDIDLLCILTPYERHSEIIKYFIDSDIKILVDKLVSLNLDEVKEILDYTIYNKRKLNIVYHYRYGSEVLYLKERFDLSNFQDIYINIQDPYFINNQITKDGKSLGGAWMDSAPNALSFLSLFLDVSKLKLEKIEEREKNGVNIYNLRVYSYFGKRVIIEINWNEINNKETIIKTNSDLIKVQHSNQEIIVNGNLVFKNTSERLLTHYNNFFKIFNNEQQVLKEVLEIHKKLLEREEICT